jgi:hypothetical protein
MPLGEFAMTSGLLSGQLTGGTALDPRFHRVLYTITLYSSEGCAFCFCQHLVHVNLLFAAKSVISHHAMSVCWLKEYFYFAIKCP